jgi:transcriptional regulator with XRE-family HTH domain
MTSGPGTVRERLRLLRQLRGLSAQELADRCRELGLHRFTRDVIASMESRRRDFTVDEVLGLALALGVSPAHLLVPADPWPYHVGTHRFADRGEDGVTAFDWLTGQLPLEDDELWRTAHPDWSVAEEALMARIERMHEMNTRAEALVAARATPKRATARTTKRGASRGKR